jgi:uncharacterized protein (DUF2126 family)
MWQQNSPYLDIHDQLRHANTMRSVADEIGRPVDEIENLYEDVLKQLSAGATVTDYLPVLVSKKIKALFHHH